MSGWSEERRILESWFATQWAALAESVSNPFGWNAAKCPVEWEGQTFDPPADGGPWISMFLLNAPEGTQITLGTPALNRYVGMLQFTISCPIGKATGANEMAREIGDQLDLLWKGRRFQTSTGRIRCRVPGLRTLGNVENRWIAVLTVPYLRDNTEPIPPAVGLA